MQRRTADTMTRGADSNRSGAATLRTAYATLAMMLLLALCAVSAAAQVACIPPPTNRVPGLPGPPDWLGSINPPVKTGIDDPRWDGAGSFTWANGVAGDTAQFRSISSGNKLFLSWWIKLPPKGPPAAANVLYVGFSPGASTAPNFAMTVNLHSTTSGSDTSDYDLTAFSVDSSGNPTALPAGTLPAWMSNTRVWITQTDFTVEMIVPISDSGIGSGLNLGSNFKMWFEMQEALPPSTPATVWDAIYPDGRGGTPIAADVVTSGFGTVFPAPSTWGSFHLSSGPGDAACTLGGISINESQIGTVQSGVNSREILFAKTGTNTMKNTFFASPVNGMTTLIPAGGITAKFRIADWGSTYDPNAPFTTIPGGDQVPSKAAIPAGATADNANITFDWTVQDISGGEQWLTDFRGGKEPDQCMLVTLAGGALVQWQANHAFAAGATVVDSFGNLQKATVAGNSGATQPVFSQTAGGTVVDNQITWTNSGPAIGPGLTFLNNSVLTNMDFVGASDFSRRAAIDIRNLKPIGAGDRDVFLYVQKTFMSATVDPQWKDAFYRVFGSPGNRPADPLQSVTRGPTPQQIDQLMPSYRVYVFHDFGKKVTIGGKDFFIVHPQSGYGYYVMPHEDVNYWATDIKGATQIAPDLYKISIPNNGIGHVTDTIRASVQPITVKHCGFHSGTGGAFFLFGGLLLAGLVTYRIT
jgi:hypothetical protein